MKHFPLIATVTTLMGCFANTDSNPSGDVRSSNTSQVASVNLSDSPSQQFLEAPNGTDARKDNRIVGKWQHGDHINAIHVLINADGTFSTYDWNAFSGRGETRTSEGVWSVSGNTITLIEKTYEGNANAGGRQRRNMKGRLTDNVLVLNDLEFRREDQVRKPGMHQSR